MRAVLLCSLLLAQLPHQLPPQHTSTDTKSGEGAGLAADPTPRSQTPADAIAIEEDLLVEWSESHPPLAIPRGERLVYRVRAGVGGLDAPVGTVTMESSVETYRSSVLLLGGDGGDASHESGRLRIHAEGDYQLFRMDAKIETLVHPVRWPFLVYNFTQTGSKDRRQEVLVGWKEGAPHARYRSDTTKGAPKGTRIWKEPKESAMPVESLDMVSASYYARTMIREDRLFMRFPVADKLDLWEVSLKRGKQGRVETGAGAFDALQIVLEPKPYPGEEADEGQEEKAKTFKGLFGLHGSISFWVERTTGVPVLISGDIPVGLIDIAVSVVLQGYSGTPPAFRPLR
jgi:hypothetical protein